MGFLADNMAGRLYEEHVRQALNSILGWNLRKNSDIHGIDLVRKTRAVEVKYDRQLATTGNAFIEFEYNGVDGKYPSGIVKYDFPIWFAIGDYRKFWVIIGTKAELMEKVESWKKKYRVLNAGDGYKARGVLIPEECLDLESHLCVMLNMETPTDSEVKRIYHVNNPKGGRPSLTSKKVVYSLNNRKPRQLN